MKGREDRVLTGAEGNAAATPFEAVQQHLAPHREDGTAGSMHPTPKFGLMGGNRGPRARVSPGPNDGRRSDRSDDERPFRTTGFEPSQQVSTSPALGAPQGSSPSAHMLLVFHACHY